MAASPSPPRSSCPVWSVLIALPPFRCSRVGELIGVLYLESERAGDFGPGNERLLRILGGHLAGALAVLQADRGESAPPEPAQAESPGGEPLAVTYYQADDSVFVDGAYMVKGVPGRILWKLLREHDADGRISFTNRELRLDERLGLPPGTTTSKLACSCCASALLRWTVGSRSTELAAAGWRCTSARRSPSARCRRRVRCAPLTSPPPTRKQASVG